MPPNWLSTVLLKRPRSSRIDIVRVGIELAENAADGRFDQLAAADRLDVVALDLVERVGKHLIQLVVFVVTPFRSVGRTGFGLACFRGIAVRRRLLGRLGLGLGRRLVGQDSRGGQGDHQRREKPVADEHGKHPPKSDALLRLATTQQAAPQGRKKQDGSKTLRQNSEKPLGVSSATNSTQFHTYQYKAGDLARQHGEGRRRNGEG